MLHVELIGVPLQASTSSTPDSLLFDHAVTCQQQTCMITHTHTRLLYCAMVDSGRMVASASVRWYPITASLLSLCHTQPPCVVPYLNETLQHSVMISFLKSLFSYDIKSAYLNGELRELIPELSGQATGPRRIVDSPLLNTYGVLRNFQYSTNRKSCTIVNFTPAHHTSTSESDSILIKTLGTMLCMYDPSCAAQSPVWALCTLSAHRAARPRWW